MEKQNVGQEMKIIADTRQWSSFSVIFIFDAFDTDCVGVEKRCEKATEREKKGERMGS